MVKILKKIRQRVKPKSKMIKYWVSGVYRKPDGHGVDVPKRYVRDRNPKAIAVQGGKIMEAKSKEEAHKKILADVPPRFRRRILGRVVYAYGRCGYREKGGMRIMHVLEDKEGRPVYEYHLDEVGKTMPWLSGVKHRAYMADVREEKKAKKKGGSE